MPIDVREATADDLGELALLRWLSHGESNSGYDGQFEDYRVGFAQWWFNQGGCCRAVVGADGGRLVGMGFLALVNRVPIPGQLHRSQGDVQSMYVVPDHRGCGTGTRILRALIDLARENRCDRITVWSGRRAVILYEREGFEHNRQLMNLDLRR